MRGDQACRATLPGPRSDQLHASPASRGQHCLAKDAGAVSATSPDTRHTMHGADADHGSPLCRRVGRMVYPPALAHAARAALDRVQRALQRNGFHRCCHCRSCGCTRVLLLGPPGQQDYFPTAHLGNPLTTHSFSRGPFSMVSLKETGAPVPAKGCRRRMSSSSPRACGPFKHNLRECRYPFRHGVIHGFTTLDCISGVAERSLRISCRNETRLESIRDYGCIQHMNLSGRTRRNVDFFEAGSGAVITKA